MDNKNEEKIVNILKEQGVSLDECELGIKGITEDKYSEIAELILSTLNSETELLETNIEASLEILGKSINNCNKISIITETEKDDKVFNVLEFNMSSIKMKGNSLFVKVDGKTAISQKRVGISKLKLDKLI